MKIKKEDDYYSYKDNINKEFYSKLIDYIGASWKDDYKDTELKKDLINKLVEEVNNNYNEPMPNYITKWNEYLGSDGNDDMYDKKSYSKNCKNCGAQMHGNTKGDLCKTCKEKMAAEQAAIANAVNTQAKKKNKKVLNVVEDVMEAMDFQDPAQPKKQSKKSKKTKKEEDEMPKTKNSEVEGKSVLYNKHGMIYVDLHKEPEQQHLFAFNKMKMPKGLSIVCKGCNEEIEHFSEQFRSYYCPHCLIFYPDRSFDLDTNKGKQELEQWVELIRPIVPGAKKVSKPKKDDKEALKEIKEATEEFKKFEEAGGDFSELNGIFGDQ